MAFARPVKRSPRTAAGRRAGGRHMHHLFAGWVAHPSTGPPSAATPYLRRRRRVAETAGMNLVMRPLDGITVVALEQAVAAPFATRQLADLGARVIKIERPAAGDFARHYDHSVLGQASYFVWLNRGKESVELDVRSADGQAATAALLTRADVFVQNLVPGAAERLELGAEALRARYPRLICCSVSGYGPDGPYRHKKAYDLLVQCEAGLLSVTGTPGEPCKAGISVADIAAGMYAFSGVLTALYERERTGHGSSFDVALLDALGEWMSQPYYYTVYGDEAVRRTGARHASISPYGPYSVAGGQVFLGLQNDREWAVLCERVLRRPELTTDPRFATNTDRVTHDDELTRIIPDALRALSPSTPPRSWPNSQRQEAGHGRVGRVGRVGPGRQPDGRLTGRRDDAASGSA